MVPQSTHRSAVHPPLRGRSGAPGRARRGGTAARVRAGPAALIGRA
ncbi:hypothetical protein HMPREF0682_1861 [Propionibacterium acidifaciens F0233]|uniref:Uncharacterized protein n=1 Tax=Propionibacterium acidifaciens F0233 TaxID=553198 RepID=U2QGH0_9ACTN|nr:hypothetical protein HMPREF0682_1861 [Propionibacterium acidifaciens F0233]